MTILLGAGQIATLGRVIEAFTWPSLEPPYIELADTSFHMEVVRLFGADKEQEDDVYLEFAMDEEGGLWLFEYSKEMLDRGEYPEFWPAVLRQGECCADNGSTFCATLEEAVVTTVPTT